MKLCVRGYDMYPTPLIPNIRRSGLTLYTENLLRYWRAHVPEFEVSFVRSAHEDNPSPVVVDGVPVYGIDTNRKETVHDPKQCLLSPDTFDAGHEDYAYRAAQFAKIIESISPDVINLHNARPALEFIHAMRAGLLTTCRAKIILTMHDLNDDAMRVIAEHQKLFTALIAISTSVAERMEQYRIPRENITLIASGINVESYRETLRAAAAPDVREELQKKIGLDREACEAAFLILMPARRVRHKGHLLALQALAKLSIRNTRTRKPMLLLSGAGMSESQEVTKYVEELRAAAVRLGIEQQVLFLPHISMMELAGLYQLVHVVLTPSTEPEGFCFANIEAMLARVPVVTSNTGGPLDYIQDGETGYLVSAESAHAVEQALERLLLAPPPTSLLDAAERRAASYTLNKTAERYTQVCKNLETPHHGGS